MERSAQLLHSPVCVSGSAVTSTAAAAGAAGLSSRIFAAAVTKRTGLLLVSCQHALGSAACDAVLQDLRRQHGRTNR